MRRKEFWQISFEKERRTFDNPDLKRDFCRGRFIAPTADLSAFRGIHDIPTILLINIIVGVPL